MRRFKFGLQPVLDHRERIENEKEQSVAARRRAYDEANHDLDRLNEEFQHREEELQEQHRVLRTDELRLHYAHLHYLDRVIAAQIRIVAERQAELNRARQDLVVARKDRKVVDKLKERRRTAFVAEEMRLEQLELDDANRRRVLKRSR